MDGNGPPHIEMTSAVFNFLKSLTYDPNKKCFKDTQGNEYYLFLEYRSAHMTGYPQWFYATLSQGGAHPVAFAPQVTGDVITGGTQNRDGTIKYQGSNYVIRLERNPTDNTSLAKAVICSCA